MTTTNTQLVVAWNAEAKTWTLNGFPIKAPTGRVSDRQLAQLVWAFYGAVDVVVDRDPADGRTVLFTADMAEVA